MRVRVRNVERIVSYLLEVGPCCEDQGRHIGPGPSAGPGREALTARRAREQCWPPNRRCERSTRCDGLAFPLNAELRNHDLRSPRTTYLPPLPYSKLKHTPRSHLIRFEESQIHTKDVDLAANTRPTAERRGGGVTEERREAKRENGQVRRPVEKLLERMIK